MNFTVDFNIAAGYRRRADAALGATRNLSEAVRAARYERDDLLSVARRRRQSGEGSQTSGGEPEALDWLSEKERSRFNDIAAEIVRHDADLATAEKAGSYPRSIGAAVAEHLKAVEATEMAVRRVASGNVTSESARIMKKTVYHD